MFLQIQWIEDEKYLLGISLSKCPSDLEVVTAWSNHRNAERFRAFYVLRYLIWLKNLIKVLTFEFSVLYILL